MSGNIFKSLSIPEDSNTLQLDMFKSLALCFSLFNGLILMGDTSRYGVPGLLFFSMTASGLFLLLSGLEVACEIKNR